MAKKLIRSILPQVTLEYEAGVNWSKQVVMPPIVASSNLSDSGVKITEKTRRECLERLNRFLSETSIDHGLPLREYQIPPLAAFRDHLKAGQTSSYMRITMRAGKTAIYSKLAMILESPTLVVTEYVRDVKKVVQEFSKFAPTLSCSRQLNASALVDVMTYSAFVGRMKSGQIDLQRYRLFIWDECDLALTTKRIAGIDRIRPHALVLGLSGTDAYHDRAYSGTILVSNRNNWIKSAIKQDRLTRIVPQLSRLIPMHSL